MLPEKFNQVDHVPVENETVRLRRLIKWKNSPEKETYCQSKMFKLNRIHLGTFVSSVNQNNKRNKT